MPMIIYYYICWLQDIHVTKQSHINPQKNSQSWPNRIRLLSGFLHCHPGLGPTAVRVNARARGRASRATLLRAGPGPAGKSCACWPNLENVVAHVVVSSQRGRGGFSHWQIRGIGSNRSSVSERKQSLPFNLRNNSSHRKWCTNVFFFFMTLLRSSLGMPAEDRRRWRRPPPWRSRPKPSAPGPAGGTCMWEQSQKFIASEFEI